jgi:HlyD family secretion protein
VAVGRKNRLFAGSGEGGRRAAGSGGNEPSDLGFAGSFSLVGDGMSKTGWAAAAAIVVLGAGGAYYVTHAKPDGPRYRAMPVDRGTVTANVTATGTLSAVTTVAIGSQVSGIISKLYVDFNSKVKKGQLLAELDPTPFIEAMNQQRANVEKAKADLRLAEVNLGRQKRLRELQLIAASDYDTAAGTRDDAAAALKQNEAMLDQAQTNLNYTKITAPIDGVVVDREYNVGQTVAASFQAPLIFSIAQDLTKMQVLTNIDESDVGGIKVGQHANFTVDAYPDQTFHGSVAQIRLSTTTVQNVVTYPVMLDVPNLEGRLLPGMTADVVIPVDSRRDVLRVPNAALRFKPDSADVLKVPGQKDPADVAAAAAPRSERPAAAAGQAGAAGAAGPGGSGGRAAGGAGRKPSAGGSHPAVVYVEVPGSTKLRPVLVTTQVTDGTYTAVLSQDLKAGDQVVIGLQTSKVSGSAARGPRF